MFSPFQPFPQVRGQCSVVSSQWSVVRGPVVRSPPPSHFCFLLSPKRRFGALHPQAEPPFIQKLGSHADTNSLLFPQLEMEARVGIGLGEADFESKNSLVLLVIQHVCETILQDGFTTFC